MSASYFRPRIIFFAFLFFYIVTIDFMFIMQIKLTNQIKTCYDQIKNCEIKSKTVKYKTDRLNKFMSLRSSCIEQNVW